jgi:hypothetical protein
MASTIWADVSMDELGKPDLEDEIVAKAYQQACRQI